MIFGPKKELKEKVKNLALNSDRVADEQIETAMKLSKILQTRNNGKEEKQREEGINITP